MKISKEYQIALKVVKEKLFHKQDFSFEELQNEIIKKQGILRILPGFTLGEYITELEEDGFIQFNPIINKFQVL